MNLSQLYYFQKLAELQHYTHAAEELFISQPTLSHAIASLEESLGCKLFAKRGRNIQLTEDGRIFKRYVDQSLGILDEGVAAIKARQGKLSGRVRIGAISTVRADFLPAAIVSYRNLRGSLVELQVEQGTTRELVEALAQDKLDLAIAADYGDPRVHFSKLFTQSMSVIVQEDHPLAARESVSLAELASYEVYTYRPDIPIGEAIDKFLRLNGYEPEELKLNRDSDDDTLIGGFVASQPVVGLVLVTSNLLTYRNLKVVPLKEAGAGSIYTVGLLRLKDARLSPAAQDFFRFLERFPATNRMLPDS